LLQDVAPSLGIRGSWRHQQRSVIRCEHHKAFEALIERHLQAKFNLPHTPLDLAQTKHRSKLLKLEEAEHIDQGFCPLPKPDDLAIRGRFAKTHSYTAAQLAVASLSLDKLATRLGCFACFHAACFATAVHQTKAVLGVLTITPVLTLLKRPVRRYAPATEVAAAVLVITVFAVGRRLDETR